MENINRSVFCARKSIFKIRKEKVTLQKSSSAEDYHGKCMKKVFYAEKHLLLCRNMRHKCALKHLLAYLQLPAMAHQRQESKYLRGPPVT